MEEVEFLKQLIRIPTVSKDPERGEKYKEIAELIAEKAKEFGLSVQVCDGEEEAKDGISRPNLIIDAKLKADKTVLLLTHYDVVAPGENWKTKPFEPHEEGGRIFGRGAADDKGGIVAALYALKEASEKAKDRARYNLVLAVTADEEVGGFYGAGYIARKRVVSPDAVIVIDDSCEYLSLGVSGVIHGKFIVKGVKGHAGIIYESQNALHRALVFGNKLLEFSLLASQRLSTLKANGHIGRVWGRFSITWIKSETMTNNIVPGKVEMGFDYRILPEEDADEALAKLRAFYEIAKHVTGIYDVDLEITGVHPGFMTSPDDPFVKEFRRLAESFFGKLELYGSLGSNDGRFFAEYKVPIISFGVIDSKSNIHRENESVSIDVLLKMKKLLVELALGESAGNY